VSRLVTLATRGLLIVVVAAALVVPPLNAIGALPGPLNDLLALGQGGGETPAAVPIQHNAEPPLVATPPAHCGPGSRPETGVQGRVPADSATNGRWCNLKLIGHQGHSGGFKVLRYVDTRGHECAFYDTALLFPINAFKLNADSLGVAVLDMSDPAHPKQTDTLTELPMMSPHESLNLNTRRGLLAAVNGNPTTEPGLVSIYDAHSDCRHPQLKSTSPVARLGHESGFSADGRTFYAASTAFKAITAVDVTDPAHPHAIWQGNVLSHGMTISASGNRAYIADPGTYGSSESVGNLLILDTSQIQARKPNPKTREISRLTWRAASIPQNAIPFTAHGRHYLLEIDEYTQGTTRNGDKNQVGGARIIDITDERKPHVVSLLRLQVDQPADHAAASHDPGQIDPAQGYASHYCNIPTQMNPQIVACSFISSGLRVFDISDLRHPKAIGYFVAPTRQAVENGFDGSNFAMSKPAFAAQRHEIWYSDGTSGFYVLRVAASAWPVGGRPGCLARRAPIGPRNIGRVRLGLSRRALLRRVPAPRSHTARTWTWCVKGRRGKVSAVFNRRGRVALVKTTAPRHGNRRIHPGTSVRALHRAYPRLKRVSKTLARANPRSPRLFGLRRKRVRYIAVSSRRTIAARRTLRAYLRLLR